VAALQFERQHHVFQRRQVAQQLKTLEYVSQLEAIEKIKDTNRMPGHGPRAGDKAMGRHERELAQTMSEFATGKLYESQASEKDFDLRKAQINTVVDELLNMTSSATEGKFKDSKELRRALSEQIGKGDRVLPMARAIIAREEMTELASEQGLIGFKGEGDERRLVFGDEAKDAARLTADDLKNLTGTQRQKAIDSLKAKRDELDETSQLELGTLERQSKYLEDIGRGDMSLEDLERTIGQFSSVDRAKLTSAASGAGGTKKMELTGRVRIENNEMLAINGQVSTGGLEHNDLATNLLAPSSQSFG